MPSVVRFNKALKLCALDNGNVRLAQCLMDLMASCDVSPDIVTYNTMLDACAKSAPRRGHDAFLQGLEVLSELETAGLQADIITYNTLLNIAAKGAACGGNSQWSTNGLKVLSLMSEAGLEPDACSYNVLLDACARAASVRGSRGRVEEGIQVLTRMQDAGIKADVVSYNSLLNTCAKAAGVWGSVGVSQASRIIEMMGNAGVAPDITSFNCLLNAYAQAAGAGQTYQAKEIFEVLEYMRAQGTQPDQYSYNTVMNVCAKSAKAGARVPGGVGSWGLDEGLQVLQSMSEDGLEADVVTYTALLETCIASLRGTSETVEHCTMILTMMRNAGLQPNAVSYTSLITAAKMDGTPKSVALAEELFSQLPPNQRNGRMYTAMIGALARVGRVQDALQVFEEAKEVIEPDAIIYSAAMTAVAADPSKVKKLHDDMRMRGIPDDDVTRWQLKKAGQTRARSRGSPRPLQDGNLPSKAFVPPWRKARPMGTEFSEELGAAGGVDDNVDSWVPGAEGDH